MRQSCWEAPCRGSIIGLVDPVEGEAVKREKEKQELAGVNGDSEEEELCWPFGYRYLCYKNFFF